LAKSCKNGALCPGGVEITLSSDGRVTGIGNWIRIVADDGAAGPVQEHEIAYAKPLDVVEFDIEHRPLGKQVENWVISATAGTGATVIAQFAEPQGILPYVYENYRYKDFFGNCRAFLGQQEFAQVDHTEVIMKAANVEIYTDDRNKTKIDFDWGNPSGRIKWVSMTDPEFYREGTTHIDSAYLVVAIPKETGLFVSEQRAYKFVSKVFPMTEPVHSHPSVDNAAPFEDDIPF
jgi:hypothetical protein